MAEEIEQPKRRRTVRKSEQKIIEIEDGQAVMKVIPEEVVELEQGEILAPSGKPRLQFDTPEGKAVYEYVGDCYECSNKKPPVKLALFTCKSGHIRADEQLGVQLACFRRDGKSATAMCKNCYAVWMGGRPRQETRFKVL